MDMHDDMIHVCYAIHDEHGTYSKILGTSLCSLFENTKQYLTVHILQDETLNPANKNFLLQMARKYGEIIYFHKVNISDSFAHYDKIRETHYTTATFFRMVIMDILPETVEKVIYLDADTVVNLDILTLWEESLKEGSESWALGAVRDTVVPIYGKKDIACLKNMLVAEDYFNAGVLLMDIKKLREDGVNLLALSDKFLQDYPDCKYYDQDALNVIFSGRCKLLPAKYNRFAHEKCTEKEAKDIKAICHYITDLLNVDEHNMYNQLFWHYFLKTPWCNEFFLMKAFQCSYNLLDRHTEYLRRFWQVFHRRGKHIYCGNVGSEKAIRQLCPFGNEDEYWPLETKSDIPAAFKALASRHDNVMIVMVTSDYLRWLRLLLQFGYREDVDFFDGRCLFKPAEGGSYPMDTHNRIYRYIMGM